VDRAARLGAPLDHTDLPTGSERPQTVSFFSGFRVRTVRPNVGPADPMRFYNCYVAERTEWLPLELAGDGQHQQRERHEERGEDRQRNEQPGFGKYPEGLCGRSGRRWHGRGTVARRHTGMNAGIGKLVAQLAGPNGRHRCHAELPFALNDASRGALPV
jgi:hypothetical protein